MVVLGCRRGALTGGGTVGCRPSRNTGSVLIMVVGERLSSRLRVPRGADRHWRLEVRHRGCSPPMSGAHRIDRPLRMSPDCQIARSLPCRSRRHRNAAPERQTPTVRLPAARAGHRYAEPRLTVTRPRAARETHRQRSGNRRPFCSAVRCFCRHTRTLISRRQSWHQ